MNTPLKHACSCMSMMQSYPIVENWDHKIKKHLDNPALQRVLIHDFNKYTMGLLGKPFGRGQFPRDFEDYDWTSDYRGSHPEYFRYVKHGASDWVVNFYLTLAKLVEPERPWRIIRTLRHSSVWDDDVTIFDMYGLALFKGGAPESFVRATLGTNHVTLAPGELLKTYPPVVETNALGSGERTVASAMMAGEANGIFSQTFVVMA